MNVQAIVMQMDQEISRLRQARELLAPLAEESSQAVGRPKGTTTKHPAAATPEKAPKRQFTPDGRRRIAAAQKARWAARKSGAERTPQLEGVTATEPSTEIPIGG